MASQDGWLKRWRGFGLRLGAALLLTAAQGGCQVVLAADEATLQRVAERLRVAAAPWCGSQSELDVQGVRRCVLPIRSFAAGDLANAFSFFGGSNITTALLRQLDEPQVAAVVGHEIAHHVLGHGRVRLQQQAPHLASHPLTDLLPQAHPDTPLALQAQEFDADTLGFFLAMLAGYPVDQALALFDRLPAALQAEMGGSNASHPPVGARRQAVVTQAAAWCPALRSAGGNLPLPERLLPEADYRRDEVQALARRVDADRLCASPAAASAPARQA